MPLYCIHLTDPTLLRSLFPFEEKPTKEPIDFIWIPKPFWFNWVWSTFSSLLLFLGFLLLDLNSRLWVHFRFLRSHFSYFFTNFLCAMCWELGRYRGVYFASIIGVFFICKNRRIGWWSKSRALTFLPAEVLFLFQFLNWVSESFRFVIGHWVLWSKFDKLGLIIIIIILPVWVWLVKVVILFCLIWRSLFWQCYC